MCGRGLPEHHRLFCVYFDAGSVLGSVRSVLVTAVPQGRLDGMYSNLASMTVWTRGHCDLTKNMNLTVAIQHKCWAGSDAIWDRRYFRVLWLDGKSWLRWCSDSSRNLGAGPPPETLGCGWGLLQKHWDVGWASRNIGMWAGPPPETLGCGRSLQKYWDVGGASSRNIGTGASSSAFYIAVGSPLPCDVPSHWPQRGVVFRAGEIYVREPTPEENAAVYLSAADRPTLLN